MKILTNTENSYLCVSKDSRNHLAKKKSNITWIKISRTNTTFSFKVTAKHSLQLLQVWNATMPRDSQVKNDSKPDKMK